MISTLKSLSDNGEIRNCAFIRSMLEIHTVKCYDVSRNVSRELIYCTILYAIVLLCFYEY